MLYPPVVFEAVDQLPDGPVKQGSGPGRGETGRLADAAAAGVVLAPFRLKGDTADLAHGGADQAAPLKAVGTQVQVAGIGYECLAEMAAGREENVEQRLQHR
jgi:hypothetical protein